MVGYVNNSGGPITSLTLSFDYERYRRNLSAAFLTFFYSADGTNWNAVAAGDSAPGDFAPGTSTYTFIDFTQTKVFKTNVVITGLNVVVGGKFYLRWNFDTGSSPTGSQGLGLDNFILSVNGGGGGSSGPTPHVWNTASGGSGSGNGFGFWSAPGNWVNGTIPSDASRLVFPGVNPGGPGSSGGNSTNNLNGLRLDSLVFSNYPSTYLLRGNPLVISNGVGNYMTSSAPYIQSIYLPLTLGRAQTFHAASNSLNLHGPITNGGHTLTVDGERSTAFYESLSGSGGLVKNGSGDLRLSGSNSFTGTTTVNAGTLYLANGSALVDNAALALANNSILSLSASETLGSVAGGVSTIIDLGGYSLTTGGDNTSTTVAGSITGGFSQMGTLSKVGSGTLQLSGVNTYRGDTLISNGVLKLSGSGSISNSSNIVIASAATLDVSQVTGGFHIGTGQTLRGGGTVQGMATVNGTVWLEDGLPSTLTFGNALTLTGGVRMEVIKSGTTLSSDQFIISDAVGFGGLLVVVGNGDVPAVGDSYTLFSAGSFSGSFSHVSLPTLFSTGVAWDTNKLATTGILDLYAFTNHTAQSVSTPSNTAVLLPIAKLLAKASSSRGTPTLAGLDLRSRQVPNNLAAFNLSVEGSNIRYTPPPGFTGQDQFECTLQDGHGTIQVTVFVTVTDPDSSGGSNLTIQGNGFFGVRLIIAGTPGKTYQLQFKNDLSDPDWFTQAEFEMSSTGIKVIDDGSGSGSRYYRTIVIDSNGGPFP